MPTDEDPTFLAVLDHLLEELVGLERATEAESDLAAVQEHAVMEREPVLRGFRSFIAHALGRLAAVRVTLAERRHTLANVAEAVHLPEVLTDVSSELGALRTEAEAWRTRLGFAARAARGTGSAVAAAATALLRRTGSWLRSVFIQTLSSALGKLWRLISRMMRPKEWKLGGKLNTGVFGMAETSIEITFGS